MRQSVRLTASLLLLLVSAVCYAQDKVPLAYKAVKDQVVRYKSGANLSIEAGGNKVTLEVVEIQKSVFTDIAASGNITYEQETESSEVSYNGQKAPSNDDKTKTTITIAPNGTLVGYKSTSMEAEQAKIGARLYPATNPVFDSKPVGVGDKWTHEYKGNGDIGTQDAKAEYEVIGFEKVGGVDAVKIKMTYTESGASPAISAKGFVTVERASGDTVASEMEIENVPFGMGAVASGKLTSERTEGSPVGAKTTPGKPGKPDAKPEPKKEKTIDETVKDYEKLPGLFTLYRKKESGRDTIYAEVKEELLEKLLLLQATASTGNTDQIKAGEPINDIVFKFVKNDDKLLLVRPNLSYIVDPKSPLAKALKRSVADAILESFKIEAVQPDRKSLLINVSDLFRGDIAQISSAFSSPMGGLFGGGGTPYLLDREKTYISALKSFPDNLVVETQYNFLGGRGGVTPFYQSNINPMADARSLPFKVVYNVFALPMDNGYRPRLADPRVGFFTTEQDDKNNDRDADTTVRYIYRWNLEKADPKAKLSPPKKPIVFWLDNAIPLEHRSAAKEALLAWNKAFERIGIKDAVEVKQMPDNADWDHADMRYNVVRWVTGVPYAIALFRVNPLTGQILNASIAMDADFARIGRLDHKDFINPAGLFAESDQNALKPHSPNYYSSVLRCELGKGAKEQAWFGHTALSMLTPMAADEEKAYVHAYIREVLMHEMGHIMGLRHNFIASTYHDDKELENPGSVGASGVTASVMDYTPFNVYAIKHKGVNYFSDCVGPYDKWAIEYGYAPIDAKTSQGELYKLSEIASKCNQPGLAYQSDENANQFDPRVWLFDLGRDPISYWQKYMQTSRYLIFNLDKRLPKKGDSYYEFTRNFDQLFFGYVRGAAISSNYIGGLRLNRNHRGDAGEKPTLAPISATDQKRALKLLNTYIFAESAFAFPKGYYVRFTDPPFGNPNGASPQPVRDLMASIQTSALKKIFAPSVLSRIINNEYKVESESDALTLPYLYNSVAYNVWSELPAHKNVSTLRRQLQRTHLDTLISQFLAPSGVPEDAKMLAWDTLRNLRTKLASAKRSASYDAYTRIHLDESLMKIDRALDAKQTLGGASAGRQLSILDLLSSEKPAQPEK